MAMAEWILRRTHDQAVQVCALAWHGIVFLHKTLILHNSVSLYPGLWLYKWVLVKLLPRCRGNAAMDKHPI